MKRINIPDPEIIGITGGCFSGREGMYSNHLSSIIEISKAKFRIYLCRRFWFDDKTTTMDIGYVDSPSLMKWPDIDKAFIPLKINGLPDGCQTAHPNVIKKDGKYEMFFWVHGNGMVRYLKSTGTDGINFTVENLSAPCLYHPADFSVACDNNTQDLLTVKNHKALGNIVPADPRSTEVRHKLISNDATWVSYDLDSPKYTMYTVHLIPSESMPERKVKYDNAPNWLRVIHCRISNDGVSWGDSKPVVIPDKNDPVDLQFYSMTTCKINLINFAIIGYYLVKEQVLELQAAMRMEDGKWLRNATPWRLRQKLSLNGKDVKMLFPGTVIVDDGYIIISATCCSYLHNQIGHLNPEEYIQANVLFRLPLKSVLHAVLE